MIQQRIGYFDCLRGIAIIMVIGIHTCNRCGIGNLQEVISLVIREMINYAVPLFITLSAFFMTRKMNVEGADRYLILRRQVIKVYLPMLVWSLPFLIVGLNAGKSPIRQLTLFFTGGYSIYYFIALIIQCYAISCFVRKINLKGLAISGMISLSASVCIAYGGGATLLFAIQVFAIISGFVPFVGKYSAIQPSLFAIAFFICQFRVNKPVYQYYILAGLILCLPFIIMSRFIGGSVSSQTMASYYWQAFISLSLFGVLLHALSYVNWGIIMGERQICIIKWLDRNSYYIYLTHYWFTPMGLVNVFNTGFNIQNTLLFIACVMISTMLFSVLIDKIFLKHILIKR